MQIFCSGEGQLQFLWYRDNKDCESGKGSCDIYFEPIKVLDGDNREVYKETKTAVTKNRVDVYFSWDKFDTLNDPIDVNIARNKQVTISITARDEDSGLNPDDDMHSLTGLVVPFATIGVDDGWQDCDPCG